MDYRTKGGRVLTVVGRGPDLDAARRIAEDAADEIRWLGLQRRHDIAADAPVAPVAAPEAAPMIRRYTLPEMGAIWSEAARFEAMLRVEIAVARAQVGRGLVPAEALAAIEARAKVDVDRIAEIEQTTDHDVIAFVSQVAETVGPEGRYLHLGLTSSDVVDTGLALQLQAAGDAAARRLRPAPRRPHRPGSGRGRDADDGPDPFGPRRADDARGQARRLGVRARPRPAPAGRRGRPRSRPARSSGPVGTYSHLEPELEAEVLGELGLRVDPVSTQIVQRDRHAALLTAIAITGGSLERFATEVRNLQHTEIGELQEPFRTGQKGSSAMPHKRNPILSERIAGLARLLRGYAGAALEDQPLWHERDISHSSAERVLLPDATILLDYMLVRMTGLVEGLVVRPERMRENIDRGLGLHASSRVLVALVDEGGLNARRGLCDRPALRAPRGRRAARAARPAGDRARSSPGSCRSAGSTPASTTRPSSATRRRSSPGSTGSRRAAR